MALWSSIWLAYPAVLREWTGVPAELEEAVGRWEAFVHALYVMVVGTKRK